MLVDTPVNDGLFDGTVDVSVAEQLSQSLVRTDLGHAVGKKVLRFDEADIGDDAEFIGFPGRSLAASLWSTSS
jgi:hypothetical protein